MSNVVLILQTWFDGLPSNQQEEIIQFLYDDKILIHKGEYFGPVPGIFVKGLHMGPAPQSLAISHILPRLCPTCGKPL